MTPLEKDIEKALGRMVGRRGGRCLKWVCPGWAGVPDRIVLLPGGRILFVELKRPKGSDVSALQQKWAEWLTKLGFHHRLVFNHADLKALEQLFESWDAPATWLGPFRVDAGHNGYKCSKCGFFGVPGWVACPKCGAKMDGGNDNGKA